MKTIYNYKLDVIDKQVIQLPQNAQILSVQEQHGELCLWALVEEQAETEDWTIQIIGTGNPAYHVDAGDFIGTVQARGGYLVWHIFAQQN